MLLISRSVEFELSPHLYPRRNRSRTPSSAYSDAGRARGRRLLYVGNQSRYKNVMLIAQAVELPARLPGLSIFLTLPADHPFSRQQGFTGLGYLTGPELSEAYSRADALVLPSFQETVALPLLEAMSAGTPIIAADRPYAREMCGTAALFFDPWSPSSLASCIELVLTDPVLRTRMVTEGSARSGASTVSAVRTDLEEVAAVVQSTATSGMTNAR